MNRIFIDDCQHWLNSTEYPHKDGYDLIYIDPPYDTGTKFSYNDKRKNWIEWMTINISSGYKHLKEDGVIFISIDDNRLIDLCLVCDKVFGRQNKLAIMITHQATRSNSKHINVIHEYVVVYAKNKKKLPSLSIPRIYTKDETIIRRLEKLIKEKCISSGQDEAQKLLRIELLKYKSNGIDWISNYRCVDAKGDIFYPQDLSVPGEPNTVDISEIGLYLEPLPTRKWSSIDKFKKLYEMKMIELLDGRPYEKHYLKDAVDSIASILPFYSRQGTEDLKRLGCNDLFDTPKPVAMIELFILAVANNRSDVKVLDFFGGSGSTAQALFQAQEKMKDINKTFSFDIVQIDEKMDSKSKPYRTAFKIGIEPNIGAAIKYRIDKYIEDKPSLSYEYIIVE